MKEVGLDAAVHWLQVPPAGVHSLAELKQVAAARCAFLHGGTANDWVVRADWDAVRPFVCAAVRREDAPGGAWRSVWQLVQAKGDGWHAMVGSSAAHRAALVWHMTQGRVDAMSMLALAANADAQAAVAERMRLEIVNHPSLAQGHVQWHTPASGPVRADRRMATAAALLTAAAVAASAVVAWQAWDTASQLSHARLELQAAQRRAASPKPQAETSKVSPAERQAWNRIARQLNTPWPALLDALEAGTPEHIALVSIEPDARQSAVRIQAEAKSLDALLEYAQQLGTVPLFQQVSLVKHETNEQDPNKPVRLGLDVRLRPTEGTR